jgi:hypothetical protein
VANILQADSQLVCSPTSFLGERPERLSTFAAGSDTDIAKVEHLHAYPRAVCKRALLPTCCSDIPPTLFANRRRAAKCMVIQVRSCQAQRRSDAVPHASCSLRRASSSPRRPVKQCRISPATAGKMTTHPTMPAICNSLAARGCADVSEAMRTRDPAPSRGR